MTRIGNTLRALMSLRAGGADRRGFTLIEMIVALAILSISLGVLFAAFSQDFARLRLNKAQMQTRALAQALLEETAGRPVTFGTRRGTTAQGLAWTVSITPYGPPEARKAWRLRPAEVTATVAWSDGRDHRATLSTLRFAGP